MNQLKVWNKIAPKWAEYKTESPLMIKDFLDSKKGNILDLGCGSGRNFLKLKNNATIYGVDFSQEIIKLAEQTAKQKNIENQVNLFVAKATKLPFQDNFFDSVICIALLHCMKYKFQRKKAIKEMYRVMKPKSQMLITVWDKQAKRFKNKPKTFKVAWTIDKENNKKVYRTYYLYDFEELKKQLESIGFKIIKRIEPSSNIILIVEK